MNESARRTLLKIYAKHGRSIIENPRRLEALLRDYCGALRREISVLVMAVEEHVVWDMLTTPASVPRKVLLARLAQRLCDNLGLSADAAVWAIDSWALALGLIAESEITPETVVPETTKSVFSVNPRLAPSTAQKQAPISKVAVEIKPAASSLIVAAAGGGHFTVIGEALRNAPPNSVITVREGIYNESLVLNKSVKIIGEGNPQKIIVRGQNSSPIIMQTAKAAVRGLTVEGRGAQNGKAFFAVEISRGELILENCDITSDSLSGIAVFGTDANPLVKNCRIYNCADSGIYMFDNARARIEDCDIYRNVNANVAVTQGAQPTLKNCRIFEGNNGGVVVWGNGAAGLIEDCRIYAHRLANVGVREFANPVFRNCEIHDGQDTGVYIHQNGYGTFEDCKIYRNAQAEVGISQNNKSVLRRCVISDGENSGVIVQNRGRALIENCDISGNADAGIAVVSESEVAVRGSNINRNGTVAVRVKEGSAVSVEDCDLRGNRIATWETEHGVAVERLNNLE